MAIVYLCILYREKVRQPKHRTVVFLYFIRLQTEQEMELREERVSVFQLFRIKELQMPLLISVVLQLSQQLSGINAVSRSSSRLQIDRPYLIKRLTRGVVE